MPTCIQCQQEKSRDEFYGNKKKSSRCKKCQKEYLKIYRTNERLAALKAYGGEHPTCACPGCLEDRLPFLSIDHINGGGIQHRQELCTGKANTSGALLNPGGGAFFRWLRKNNYPSGYRVLCYNCNIARSSGPCPVHEAL